MDKEEFDMEMTQMKEYSKVRARTPCGILAGGCATAAIACVLDAPLSRAWCARAWQLRMELADKNRDGRLDQVRAHPRGGRLAQRCQSACGGCMRRRWRRRHIRRRRQHAAAAADWSSPCAHACHSANSSSSGWARTATLTCACFT
eukprot:3596170-Prymnesium_polylepis.2